LAIGVKIQPEKGISIESLHKRNLSTKDFASYIEFLFPIQILLLSFVSFEILKKHYAKTGQLYFGDKNRR
jgi:hypothetical protein